jgi:CrcB protein
VTLVPPRLLLAAAIGGASGALLRHLLGELAPDGSGFPWTTFGINVVGSFLLALLPALTVVRRHRTVAVALGPGVLGGFTTLSTYAEQGRGLLADGDVILAATYLVGTLLACLTAVALASRLSTPAARVAFAAEGGDE